MLRENQLYSKLSKCAFSQKQIQYLGHIIHDEGVVVDPRKIESITGWHTPMNVTKAKSFMGLDGYYIRFVKGFSKVAHLITSFQKKGFKFERTIKCE